MNKRNQVGFSLVELAIVVLIIGFLLIGVSYGLNLIHQARMRTVISESDNFLTSIQAFSDKYQTLPGDLPTAFNVWGTSCAATAALCNGNGDGYIKNNTGGVDERFRAWQHLQLADMIPGNYSGIATTVGQGDIGINVPQSGYNSSAGWSFDYNGSYAPPTVSGQFMEIGAFKANNQPTGPLFTPQIAKLIDEKVDDGMPNNGFVMADGVASSNGCHSAATLAATYNASTVTTSACALRFTFKK